MSQTELRFCPKPAFWEKAVSKVELKVYVKISDYLCIKLNLRVFYVGECCSFEYGGLLSEKALAPWKWY